MGKGLVIVGLIVVIAVLLYFAYPSLNSTIQQMGYDKLTLPIGTIVPYNQQNSNSYPEYSFRYGSLLGDNPNRLQVWSGNNPFPKDFTVSEGATYTAFAVEIKITEVNPEYIVLGIRHLS